MATDPIRVVSTLDSDRAVSVAVPARATLVRRHFLKLSAGGLAAAVAALSVAIPGSASELDDDDCALLRTLTTRLCGGSALGLAPGELARAEQAAVAGIAEFLGESARYVPGLVGDVRLALTFVEHAPLLSRSRSRFSFLSSADQDHVLAGFMHSDVSLQRDVFVALKSLTTLFFYEQPSVYRRIGYQGPLSGGGKP